MPRITLFSIEGVGLKKHSILLAEELERLSYCVHYATDKTPSSIVTEYLKAGDVVIDHVELNLSAIERMRANTFTLQDGETARITEKSDVIVWVDVPVDKLTMLKQSNYEQSNYTEARTLTLKYANNNNWKIATFNKFPLLQSRIEQLVLTNLIYEKSGTFVFGQPENTTKDNHSSSTLPERILKVAEEAPKQTSNKVKQSKKRKRRSKPKR